MKKLALLVAVLFPVVAACTAVIVSNVAGRKWSCNCFPSCDCPASECGCDCETCPYRIPNCRCSSK